MDVNRGIDVNIKDGFVSSSNEKSPDVQFPTQCLRPQTEDKEATIVKFLYEKYGITVMSLKPLVGYCDMNFHVAPESVLKNPYIRCIPRDGFFLKISNLEDSKRPEFLYAVTKMMAHAQNKGIPCQETLKSVNGETVTQIASPNLSRDKNITYLSTLRTFLPGQILASLPLTPELLYNLGAFTAQLTQALQDFHEPYFESHDNLWNLRNCPKASEVLWAVKDTQKSQICKDILDAFKQEVLERSKELRCGQVHGDLNEHNILMDIGSTPKVCGLLDFYDTSKSYVIFDLAICAAHLLMMPLTQSHENVPRTEIPGYLLAGYESIMELYPAERRVYRISIAARIVTALLLSAHTHIQDPDNLYVVNNMQSRWEALNIFWTSEAASLEKSWEQISQAYSRRRGGN